MMRIQIEKGENEMDKKHKLNDETLIRMAFLAENKYHCAQIIMQLALEREGKENSDVIRAVAGLADGVGFFNGTCGILTGCACMIAWYSGKGSDEEEESEKMMPMLQDLGDWFEKEIEGKFKSSSCNDIVGDQVGTEIGIQICGELLIKTFAKANEILVSYGFIKNFAS
jgi:hypothetical protein